MSKKDDLTKICDTLENCSKNKYCYKNEIVCVKKVMKDYIGDDRNRILQLKALVKYHDCNRVSILDIISKIITVSSFVLVILYNISKDSEKFISGYGVVAFACLITILVIDVIGIAGNKRKFSREKWRHYIEVVLTEMERDIQE